MIKIAEYDENIDVIMMNTRSGSKQTSIDEDEYDCTRLVVNRLVM